MPCPRRGDAPVGMPRSSASSTVRAGHAQDDAVDRRRARPSGTDARRLRTGSARADVRRASSARARPALRERVLDARARARTGSPAAGCRRVLHHDAVRVPVADRPGAPADEAVDRVARSGSVSASWCCGRRTRSCRPAAGWARGSAPARGRTVPSRRRRSRRAGRGRRPVGAQPAADLDDDRALVAGAISICSPEGASRSRILGVAMPRSRSSRWSPTRSAFAIAVSAGFTAPMLGKTLVSTT